ncbi:MAG: helix-turn-helix domain-containing protein [Clostridia bacterium]|nr:helix-turn-helix domain-containing protein [Clostridia bacterium]
MGIIDMSTVIANLRREKGMTQEELAQAMGVTNQAVSKWESAQNCPDIQLLPQLADLFGVTIDSLFGRAAAERPTVVGLPWEDDNILRAVAYVGHTLYTKETVAAHPLIAEQMKAVQLIYNGEAVRVESTFDVLVNGNVQESVSAGKTVTCKDVGDKVSAGSKVECGNVCGNVTAGGSVHCVSVNGNISAGGKVECIGDIHGHVKTPGKVVCSAVRNEK